MSKAIVTVGGIKGIFTALLTEDGKLNTEGMTKAFEMDCASAAAELATDFDTVAAELHETLIGEPGLRNVAFASLARMIWDRRVESGTYAGKTREEKEAAHDRLETVLSEYLASNTETYHVGRGRGGVLIRKVAGEVSRDKDGNPVFDKDGNEIPHTRWNDKDWSEALAKSAASEARAAEKKAAKS